MPNTYSQLYVHLVFAVKYRKALIPIAEIERVHRYMASVVNNTDKCKAIQIGGIHDHAHLLVRLSTSTDVARLVKSVKVATTGFINTEITPGYGFAWQEGYGAFSVSATHIDAVANYIRLQPEHHLTAKFLDEYQNLLIKNKVEFNKEYIFADLE